MVRKNQSKGIPDYLKKNWEEKRWQRVAKFRLGSGMKEGRYWEDEDERRCRICRWGKETWEHIWEECIDWGEEKGWQEMVDEVLGEKGEGERWLEMLDNMWEEKVSERGKRRPGGEECKE